MARPKTPTIPTDKLHYYKEQLYRELAHMFTWENLPVTAPSDYIERNLVRHGYVMYYENEEIGQDVLRAEPNGYNRHDLPTQARTFAPTTNQEVRPQVERNIKYLSTAEEVEFDPTKDAVLIFNMYKGEHMYEIVNHFAHRLAMAQQAFDTTLLYANIPYIFQTSSQDTRLSIEKMFASIYNGEPFIIADEELMKENGKDTGFPTDIPFIGKEIYDVKNEIMMDFKQTVGFKTAGVDKAERVNTEEVQSNDQHTKTVLQIMLEQREKAAEAINEFFGQNIEVKLVGQDEEQEVIDEGGEEDGGSDGGVGPPPGDD